MKHLILSLGFFLALNASAAKSPPAEKPLSVQVTYGEKITSFTLTKNKTKGFISFSNNAGQSRTREITLKDYHYLQSKAEKIRGSNDTGFCSRSFTKVTVAKREVIGCLGSTSATARDVQSLTNLMIVLL